MNSKNNGGKIALSKKSILSQALAGSAQNLLLLDLGMAISMAAMVIPALLGAEGPMSFTKEQASWFVSISMIMQPLGSVFSGSILEPLGRKRALLIVNIPHIVAWLMMYSAQNVATLFCANALLGLGTGFMEAPIITYIGEISHPAIRGTLSTYSQVFTNTGIFAAYLLGTVLDWRTAAASCLAVPIATFIAVLMIPETPVWLLSKGRKEDAMEALCWVRGWAKPEEVQEEFDELVRYQQNSARCQLCPEIQQNKSMVPEIVKCPHKNVGFVEKAKSMYRDMTRKEMLRPLFLIMLMFVFHQTSGPNAIRANMVNFFDCFGVSMDGHTAAIAVGVVGIVATILHMLLIKHLGKRFMNLGSLLACASCTFLLGVYAYVKLPHDAGSYALTKTAPGPDSWFPTTVILAMNVFAFLGINIVPWIMLSEIFPLRGRGTACGIAAANAYVWASIVSKTYYNLETNLGIYGTMWFYSACTILGFILMYFLMPETEGKSLEQIEKEFSGESMPIFADDVLTRKVRRYLANRRNTNVQKTLTNDDSSLNVSTVEKEADLCRKNSVGKKTKL